MLNDKNKYTRKKTRKNLKGKASRIRFSTTEAATISENNLRPAESAGHQSRRASRASDLLEAAQVATADPVLLVEAEDDGQGLHGMARAPAVTTEASKGLQLEASGGELGKGQPWSSADCYLIHIAAAVNTSCLLDSVAFFGGAFVERTVIFVLAQELIGSIVAVLNTIAALTVLHDLPARADKPVREACSSDVVAHVCLSCSHKGSENKEDCGGSHFMITRKESFWFRGFSRWRVEKEKWRKAPRTQ